MPPPNGYSVTDENAPSGHSGFGGMEADGLGDGAGVAGVEIQAPLASPRKSGQEPMVPLRRYQEVELLLREEQKRKNRALNALKTAEENLKKMAEDMETMKNVNKAQLAILKKQFQKQIDKKNAYIEDLKRKVDDMKSREIIKPNDPPVRQEVTCGSFVNSSTPFGERLLNLFRSLVTPSPDPPARLEGPREGMRPGLLPRMQTESPTPMDNMNGMGRMDMMDRYDPVPRASMGSPSGGSLYGVASRPAPPRASDPLRLPPEAAFDPYETPQSVYLNPSSPLFPTPR